MCRVILAAVAAAVCWSGDLLAQPPPVNRVVAVARPARYEAPLPCPVHWSACVFAGGHVL